MSTQKGREITISVLKFNPRSKVSNLTLLNIN